MVALSSVVVPSAFVVGGSGPIGTAVAARMLEAGWEVALASRSGGCAEALRQAGVSTFRVDRRVEGQLEGALGPGADVLVDIAAFTAGDARQVNALEGRVGSVVVISSAAVYADAQGRALETASSLETFPELPVPVDESQPTVPADDETYPGQKVALEQELLAGPIATTVVRPCAIHGPHARLPRELFFVKRVLDGRRAVVLVSKGESRFHTTSLANLAEVVFLAATSPGDRVVNSVDPEAPSTSEICQAIGAYLDHELEAVPIPESGYERPDLSNPWAVPSPFVLGMRLAELELGYRSVATYAQAVEETALSLADEAREKDWSGTYLAAYFDYGAEDALLGPSRVI
jgi:nucleoside-diphosphate-sugar epimerase